MWSELRRLVYKKIRSPTDNSLGVVGLWVQAAGSNQCSRKWQRKVIRISQRLIQNYFADSFKMKLRIYRTLWGILEETDGEKVSFGSSVIKHLNVSDLELDRQMSQLYIKQKTNNTLVWLTTNFRLVHPSLQLRTLSKRLQGAIKSWLCDTVVIYNQFIEGLAMMGLKSRSSSRCSMGRNGILLKIMSFFQFLSCIQSITISPRFKELLKKTGLKVTFLINDFWVKYS